MDAHAKRDLIPLWVGIIAFLIAGGFVLRNLVPMDWNPTIFVAFGTEDPGTLAYGSDRLSDIDARAQLGHDGRFFFVQANDPWILDPEQNAAVLDRPLYRSQRMLYPLLAGGLGFFSPAVIVWSMIAVNVLALGVGSWAAAAVARRMGGSPWWGLAFGLNVGLLSELLIGGAGILAMALVILAVEAIYARRWWAMSTWLVAAVLTREVMLIAAVGLACWLWRQGERIAALRAVVFPAAAVGAWALYLRLRMGWQVGTGEVEEIGLPFVGFVRAFGSWLEDPISLMAGSTVMLLLLVFVRRLRLSDAPIGWAAAGFVPLTLLLTRQVWSNYFDITRAVAPLITAFLLLAFARARSDTPKVPTSTADEGQT